ELTGDRVEGPLPEVSCEGEDVRLVHEGQVATVPRLGQLEGVPDAPLDAPARVHRALGGDLLRSAPAEKAPLAGVGALGVLADHRAVETRALERAEVDVEVELEAHAEEQPALEDPGRHLGRADRAEEDGVVTPELVERRVGQHLAGAQVPGAAEVVVDGVQPDAGGANDLEGL